MGQRPTEVQSDRLQWTGWLLSLSVLGLAVQMQAGYGSLLYLGAAGLSIFLPVFVAQFPARLGESNCRTDVVAGVGGSLWIVLVALSRQGVTVNWLECYRGVSVWQWFVRGWSGRCGFKLGFAGASLGI